MTKLTRIATRRLAKFGKVSSVVVSHAGDWMVVDARVAVGGRVTCFYATGPTLDDALCALGC